MQALQLQRFSFAGLVTGFMVILLLSDGGAVAVPSSYLHDALVQGARKCTRYYPVYEQKYSIPEHLLSSIGMVESGRWHKGLDIALPWPWTINVDGKGYYFESKNEAIRAVKKHQRQGAKNIDVGCMQISMKFHPKAFRNLAQAFDPASNVRYAAKYLRSLYDEVGTWRKATGFYHSRTPSKTNHYAGKVLEAHRKILSRVENIGKQEKVLAKASLPSKKARVEEAKEAAYTPVPLSRSSAISSKYARLVPKRHRSVTGKKLRRGQMRLIMVKDTEGPVEGKQTAAGVTQKPAKANTASRKFFPISKAGGSAKPIHIARNSDSHFFTIHRPAAGKSSPVVLP